MAGRPRGEAARSELLRVRVTKEGKAAVDRARGGLSVSDYIRGLIKADIDRRMV
jgi:hypothetical protein